MNDGTMNALREKRRSFLRAFAAVGIGRALPSDVPKTQSEPDQSRKRTSGSHEPHRAVSVWTRSRRRSAVALGGASREASS
jgi:hypothetical protein